ncbi:hypothetical protein [Herbaspirillum frisingense]|uniref:hypothetical protein n=1 Tax=Herbaspirillum frisingense TaxID=92645 RepID=UPI001F3963B3|nr:hypothetical protein [Herbaspirillum frisingense]
MLRMLVCLAALLLGGCASITGTQTQPISVQATQGSQIVSGATCTLSNDAGKWYVKTPGSVAIKKSTADLLVECAKDGVVGQQNVVSKANTNVWGNILAGGIIGYAIDRNSGAGFDYPDAVTVTLGSVMGAMPGTPLPAGMAGMTPAAGRWRAVMSCDVNRTISDSKPYQANFSAEVDGNRVLLRRRNKIAEEVLSGTISGDSLTLNGMGYRLEKPGSSWVFRIDGVFMGNAKIFNGKGAMLTKAGVVARECTVVMVHTDIPPPAPKSEAPEVAAAPAAAQ